MPRKATQITCSEQERKFLERLAASKTEPKRIVDRARIVLCCLAGMQVQDVAKECNTRTSTVIKWRNRFNTARVAGLIDAPRPGAKKKYDAEFRDKVLSILEQPPPIGQTGWDGASVAKVAQASKYAVWRVLRKEGISLERQRSWYVSTEKEFAVKSADIVGLYLDPPNNALIICVDEKPCVQALERTNGYVHTSSGKVVRNLKSTHRRHGALNLFAALQVATDHIHSGGPELKRRDEFLQFMDQVINETEADKELHVILDSYYTHKKSDTWLIEHPNVHFHYTPTATSWLSLAEVWFTIMSRRAMRGANGTSIEALRQAIGAFTAAYKPTAKPFKWRKRAVRGVQSRDTIVNLASGVVA